MIGVTKLFSDAAPQLICEKLRKALPYGIYLKKSEIKRRIQNARFSDRICADMWEVAKMYHLCKDPQSARDRILKFVVGGYERLFHLTEFNSEKLQSPLHYGAEGIILIVRKGSGFCRFGAMGENHMSISNARLCIYHSLACRKVSGILFLISTKRLF